MPPAGATLCGVHGCRIAVASLLRSTDLGVCGFQQLRHSGSVVSACGLLLGNIGASLLAQLVKNLPAMQETPV